jgi:1-acyl-sn-glycerol-3-phosphate acyltransferase
MSLYGTVLGLTKFVLRLVYRVQFVGRENIPKGGALFASNHVSYLDPPLVAIASQDEVHFLARESLFQGLFGRFIEALNAHPVSDDHNLNAVKLLVKLVNQGNKVVIFPEGARSFDGEIQQIKPGIGLIMSSSKKPIVPVYIQGVFSVWPRGRKWPRLRGRIKVHFGKPLLWEEFASLPKGEVQGQIGEGLKLSLRKLKEGIKD